MYHSIPPDSTKKHGGCTGWYWMSQPFSASWTSFPSQSVPGQVSFLKVVKCKWFFWCSLLFHTDFFFFLLSLPGNHRVSNQSYFFIPPDYASHVSAANSTPSPRCSFTFSGTSSSTFILFIGFHQILPISRLFHPYPQTLPAKRRKMRNPWSWKTSWTKQVMCTSRNNKQCTMRPEIHGNALSSGDPKKHQQKSPLSSSSSTTSSTAGICRRGAADAAVFLQGLWNLW